MATRRKRKGSSGGSPFGWFAAGLVIGLGAAIFLFNQGVIPSARSPSAEEPRTATNEPELLEDSDLPEERGYDFFTVLPEMEVVVPERTLSDQASPETPSTEQGSANEVFMLQAGSFRNAADADQLKARLALLGAMANVQAVTVDGVTWHRVRVGPVQGAREADQLRRRLQDNGIDVLVLKDSG